MLTEVMSLMLLNKNDAVEQLDKVDANAQLPHPSTLRNRKLREKKRKVAEPFDTDSLLERPRNEK
jgi:hypothetical protein